MRVIGFILFSLLVATVQAQVINRGEYFIDTDPGNGNGTAVTVTAPAASVNFNFSVPTSSLSTGFHILGFRSRSSMTGFWSHVTHQAFYIVPPNTTVPATTLTRAEYFFDSDPGNGNGINLPITPGGQINTAFVVPLSSLSPGFHTLHVRIRDNIERWALAHVQAFYVVPPVTLPGTVQLTRAEYFFDVDPGQGNGTNLPITATGTQTNSFAIPVNGLTPGFHVLNIRYKDNTAAKQWTHAFQGSFYILPSLSLNAQNITQIEYYIDTDPGFGLATAVSFTPAPSVDQPVAINLTGVPSGNHVLGARVKDDKGFWSDISTALFTISNCTPPPSPVALNQARCNVGELTLTATGATGAQVYRWYDDPILNNLLFTGSSFTTPSLTVSKNYYVSIFDPGTSCESARITVAATVINIAKPTINPTGSLSICQGSSVFLSAPSGFTQYIWSKDGATLTEATQQILATQSGSYTVQVGDGTCQSEASDAVTLSVIAAPAKPVITVTGNTTICGTGTVDLTGPNGFEYVWSNGATTQTITVTQTGVFFLTVRTTGANCPSLPSDPVVVSVLTPPCSGGNPTNAPPAVNPTPLASQIEGKVEVDLTTLVSDPDNNIDFSTLRVINNVTARGVAATIDASYFLQIDYTGNPFTGTDRITLEVCDLAGLCVQQVIDIEVVGAVVVFNGLTPDGDGYNDFLFIKYIDVVEGASQNRVMIFNRWGDVVFDIENYNNIDRVFTGLSKNGSELPSGTYFYKIELSGNKPLTGFITLMR